MKLLRTPIAFVALSIALANSSASGQDENAARSAETTSIEANSAEPTSPAEATSDDANDEARPARDVTYAFGATFATSRYRTQDGNRVSTLAPGLTVNYTVGRKWGFNLRATAAFPMRGRQTSEVLPGGVNLIKTYDAQRLSFDVSFLATYRLRPTETLDLVFGAGINIHTLRLVDSETNGQHDPIELLMGGFAGFARAERRFAQHYFFAGELYAGADILDFVKHTNRATIVAPVALTLSIGARR